MPTDTRSGPKPGGPTVAVVTGGSRGIGAATARTLADRGWDVAVGYRTEATAAELVVSACRGSGRQALAIPVDVAVEADVIGLFAAVEELLGPVGALVNNAGIAAPKARVDELTADRIDRLLAVNVLGPFLCAREAVRRMSSRHGGTGGVIVNVSSVSARLGSAGQYVDYAATKGALDTMTIGLAQEVAAEGIRVNGVRPGIIETEIHAAGGDPERAIRLGPTIPVGRPGRAGEVAAAIGWLCSAEASYVTGAILDVAGAR